MNITVCLEAQLRQIAGQSEVCVLLPAGATLRDAIVSVRNQLNPDAQRIIPHSPASTNTGLLIFVNDQPILADAYHNLLLSDGDTVLFLPPIAGG